jgi:hypothetical protein
MGLPASRGYKKGAPFRERPSMEALAETGLVVHAAHPPSIAFELRSRAIEGDEAASRLRRSTGTAWAGWACKKEAPLAGRLFMLR